MKVINLSYDEVGKFRNEYFADLQINYYHQAHMDFTICDKLGCPLFSIEFDGKTGGYSANDNYVNPNPIENRRRRQLEFKVKLASLVNYPLLVLSYDETEPIDSGEKLKIIDSIIGQAMTSIHAPDIFDRNLRELSLEPCGADGLTHEEVQELFSDSEVQAEMEWDPVAFLAVDYQIQCFNRGISGYSHEHITDPPLPDYDGLHDIEGLRRRLEAMNHLDAIGSRVSLKGHSKPIVEEVLLRNFGTVGIDAGIIAEFRAFKKALTLSP